MDNIQIVKELMYINKDCDRTIKEVFPMYLPFSNDGAFEGVMTLCVKVIIRYRVKYADNLDNA